MVTEKRVESKPASSKGKETPLTRIIVTRETAQALNRFKGFGESYNDVLERLLTLVTPHTVSFWSDRKTVRRK